MTGMGVTLVGLGVTILLLLIWWDFLQSKRIDALQKRVEALEKK